MVNADPGRDRPHLIKAMLTMSLFLNEIFIVSLLHLMCLKYFWFSLGVNDTLPSSQMYSGKTE